MPVLVVPCPGCQSTLKAPESMAGKKAKCKKCGASFRIPGGEDASGDTIGDGELLSSMEILAPASSGVSPFDFSAPTPSPSRAPKKPVEPPAKKSASSSEQTIVELPPKKATEPVAKKSGAVSKAESRPASKDPPAKPAARGKNDDVPMAAPAEAPKSLDELEDLPDEEPELPAASGDPFSFDQEPAAAASTPVKSKPNIKAIPNTEASSTSEDNELPERGGKSRNYRSKGGSGSGGFGKLLVAVVVFGLVVGGVVGGVLIYLNSQKGTDTVNAEKDKEKKVEPAPADPAVSAKTDAKETDASSKDKSSKKAPAAPRKALAGSGEPVSTMLKLGPGHTMQFTALDPMAAKREPALAPDKPPLALQPKLPPAITQAFNASRKVFPPLKPDNDIGVLWQTEAGFQGSGEKLLLAIYSPAGKPQNEVVVDGDGSALPVCDLSVSGDIFVHAHTVTNKITVWETRKNMKLLDGFNPYAGKPDLKLAAVYLTEKADSLIVVSTSGAVHAFKVQAAAPIPGDFLPNKPAAKPLAAEKNITIGPGRQSVVLVVGGMVYGVKVEPMVAGSVLAEVGEVGRSLGLACSGSERLLYVFETEADGKKEKAVMDVRKDGKDIFYRWPEKEAGEPTNVGWVGDDLAMVATDRSCIWFEAEGNNFRPLGLAQTSGGMARHVASDGHWLLMPDAADPKKCLLLEYSRPQGAFVELVEAKKGAAPTALLTDKGLFK